MATTWDRLAELRDRTEGRTVAASSSANPLLTWLFIAAALLGAWAATYMAGGSKSALPHAFYVAVIVAAIRFGAIAALVAAVAAGLAAGPLMPLDVAAGQAQTLDNWMTRLGIFVAIGQITAYLCRYSRGVLSSEVNARRVRRQMREALDDDQLQLAYQPVVDLTSGAIVGVEALARWDHPERGVIPPGQFVAQAETAGCIGALTRFVLRRACEQVSSWRAEVLSGREEFRVALNVSALDLADPTFPDAVERELDRTGLPCSWLHLEITETALVQDVPSAIGAVLRLRMLGVRLAVDDFGTGESSLGYLDRFPVDILKVDSMFVRRLAEHTEDDALTHGIVALAQAMDLEVIAEGIETEDQATAVRRFGCRLAQGFLFSPPVGAAELEALLATDRPFALPRR